MDRYNKYTLEIAVQVGPTSQIMKDEGLAVTKPAKRNTHFVLCSISMCHPQSYTQVTG